MRIFLLLFLWVYAVAAAEINSPPQPANRVASATGQDKPATASTAQPEATKTCFRCGGSGKGPCAAAGCKDGKVECSGPCLRLTKGKWVHLEVAGHPPSDLWQKFTQSNGTYQAWSHKHVGEVIQMQNGKAVHAGQCRICGGTTRVKCPVCQGTGQGACDLCAGKKVVPASWTEFNNPKLKVKPAMLQMKDGRTVVGKIQMRLGGKVTVKTEDGKQVELNASEIVSEKSVQ